MIKNKYRTIIFIIIGRFLSKFKMRSPAPPSVHCLANISSLGLSVKIWLTINFEIFLMIITTTIIITNTLTCKSR